MKFLRQIAFGAAVFAFLASPLLAKAEATNNIPDFNEVYNLLQTHLAGETKADLDRAAVQGLLSQLHSRVSIVSGNNEGNKSSSNAQLLAKSALYDGPIAYLRVGTVEEGLVDKIRAAYNDLNGTNKLKGVILDLRFADGHNYAAAASAADLFLTKEAPLLDVGNGVVRSKSKSDAITLPVAILVNRQTTGAAEALAGVLRITDRAMILGTNTAGEASIDKEFPLKNGQRLRIATAEIKLGDGQTLPAQGIKPDIQVSVSPDDEKTYFADPFKEIFKPATQIAGLGLSGTNSPNGTNRSSRRLNEAELMRERKDGPDREAATIGSPSRTAEEEKPVIRDPVLGRALDLIKGISALRQFRTS
ncbi:MAG: Peptidase [Pedosphaera sp.]|nr:Peptidase [Pedosphaera sp.]